MQSHRKLAAILSADVVGYSRLMGDDDRATVETLHAYRQIVRQRVERHEGRVVDSPGDAILAEFPSALEAVECAQEIQHELAKRNAQLAEHRRMLLRIGINLGDVIEENSALYGDGVNVAARLESICDATGICISGTVFDQVEGKLPLDFKFLGKQHVKNISKPVRAYKVLGPGTVASHGSQWRHLAREYWHSSPATGIVIALALLVAIGSGVWWLDRPSLERARVAPISDKPSIAVLPFINMSADPQQDYLSDGITEDIITALARFTQLSVVARNSTFAYKGKAIDVRQVGKELGVRYIVEGSIRRSQDRARVTAQLIDSSSGTHIWAENYDWPLKDLFRVQDEVTQQIAGRLDVELDRAQLELVRRNSPKDFQAYDLVLQARKHLYNHSEANHRESRDLLERAVALDDRLSPAYIELAWVYLDEFRFGWNARPAPLDRALRAAMRGVELDPNNGFAHWRLAKVLFFRKELDRFESETRRALSLNPNHAETVADIALHFIALDRVDEAYDLAQRSLRLDPNFPSWVYFVHTTYFYRKQRYREGLSAAQQINMPDFYWTHFWLACNYAYMDSLPRSRRIRS
jgi:adenylate cyclase